MLSAFPYLLSFADFAPLLLRLVCGVYLLVFAYENLEHKRLEIYGLFASLSLRPANVFVYIISALELAGGVLLIGGAWTQVAALSMAVIMLVKVIIKHERPELISRNIHTYFFLLIILLSLVLTGPGALGADYPF